MRVPSVAPRLLTRRLCLDAILPSDVERYFALCSDPGVMRTWGAPLHRDRSETLKLIETLDEETRAGRMIRWALREREGGELIGDIGFWRFVVPRARAEVGAKLASERWSQGYMTEAMTAVFDFGFGEMGLNSIEGNLDAENPGSARMLEKLGFEHDGLIREHSYCPYRREYRDTVLCTLRASRWNAAKGVKHA